MAVLLLNFLLPINQVLASAGNYGLDETAGEAGFNTTSASDPNDIIADLVQFALGLIGTIFLILIIVSGYQWMMAGGNKDTITKARDRMTSAVIGLVIVLAAYLITNFVLDTILNL